jgi:prolipoprotein diacylglyceryltransferase
VALDRVKPLKLESVDTGGDEDDQFPTSMDPHEDYIELRGLVFDTPTVADESTVITRDGNDLTFQDTNNPTPVTLTELLTGAGGLTYVEFLLDNDPTAETGATDCSYTPTYATGKITKEEWKRNDATLIKSIDYTYASGKVSQEVRKVFATNGTTILAQVTWSYSYTGNNLTGASMTRDV